MKKFFSVVFSAIVLALAIYGARTIFVENLTTEVRCSTSLMPGVEYVQTLDYEGNVIDSHVEYWK